MIAVIDYGMGNVGSILNMLRKIGSPAKITSATHEIDQCDKIILPGVGAFEAGIKALRSLGLSQLLEKKVIEERTPILGICLGMQLLTASSEESSLPGLGWINAQTIRFNVDRQLTVPHMGWNSMRPSKASKLLDGLPEESRFYFVHSYYVECHDPSNVLGTTFYGTEFTSAMEKDNVYGVQFHPEKSHKFGLRLLKNFVDL